MNKQVIVDMGANIGNGFRRLIKEKPRGLGYEVTNSDWILIEPNTYCKPHLESIIKDYPSCDIKIIWKAVSINSNSKEFYGHPDTWYITDNITQNSSQSNSLKSSHNKQYYKSEPVITVKCIDVIDLLSDLSKKYKSIILKIDIESAEYEVLQKIIDNFDLLDQKLKIIYVEFHSKYSKDKKEKEKLQKMELRFEEFFRNKNIEFNIDW